ncbi:MAG: hypothetical protein PWP07_516 [Epulopiscium sp.]|nr:hypothetical protein [Defluviitaleaceae bacterium]MDK2787291.1 hypothetical protein [Candidatus Epulonipiscium sp.]
MFQISARRDSNPRPSPWQGDAPPLSHSRTIFGAGDGNRTHVSSLEGWCSTIELHPHSAQNRNRTSDTRIFSPLLYRLSYLGIYVFLKYAGDRNRTGTVGKDRRILSPVRLPVPPLRRINM